MIQKNEAWDILKEYKMRWPKVNGEHKELAEKYDIYKRSTEYSPPSEYKKAEIIWIIERDYNGSLNKEMPPPWYEVSFRYETGSNDTWKKYIHGSVWNDRFGIDELVLIKK